MFNVILEPHPLLDPVYGVEESIFNNPKTRLDFSAEKSYPTQQQRFIRRLTTRWKIHNPESASVV